MSAALAPEVHRRLADALLEQLGPLPCMAADPFADDVAARVDVAEQMCPGCPVLELCRAAGELEKWGVWGGIDRTPGAAARLRARREAKP